MGKSPVTDHGSVTEVCHCLANMFHVATARLRPPKIIGMGCNYPLSLCLYSQWGSFLGGLVSFNQVRLFNEG